MSKLARMTTTVHIRTLGGFSSSSHFGGSGATPKSTGLRTIEELTRILAIDDVPLEELTGVVHETFLRVKRDLAERDAPPTPGTDNAGGK